jgi:dTDP-4-dehydrorhamnose reductase
MNVVILGSSGMIGSAATIHLSGLGYSVIEVNRKGISVTGKNEVRKFDVMNDSVDKLLTSLPSDSVLVNFIGVIRHKIESCSEESVSLARKINGDFPKLLVKSAQKASQRVIQIATDCVFSGQDGAYSEDSKFDPIDVYGETKVSGEFAADNLLTLRVSVVGREIENHVELMDWVVAQPLNNFVNGYRNHFWNGVTSLHFAKILDGILKENTFTNGTFHLIPADIVTKFELIKIISELSERTDLNIMETVSEKSVDRTLRTKYFEKNVEFWRGAGYLDIPTIRIMLDEYFKWIELTDQGE